jgi:hypothetical protein
MTKTQRDWLIKNNLDPEIYDVDAEGNVSESPIMGKGEAALRSAAVSVAPSLTAIPAAAGGGEAGALLGAPFGPLGILVGGGIGALSAGAAAAYATSKAQEALLERYSPETLEKLAEGQREQPFASAAGGFLPTALTARPSLKGLSELGRPLTRQTTFREAITKPAFVEPAMNVTANVAQATGQQVADLAQGGEFSGGRLAADIALGTVFNRPTRLGRKLGMSEGPQDAPLQKLDLERARFMAETPEEFTTPREERLGIGREKVAPEQFFGTEMDQRNRPISEERAAKQYENWWKSEAEPTVDLIKQAAESVKLKIPRDRLNELANDPDVARVINDPTTLPEFISKQYQEGLQDAYDNILSINKISERMVSGLGQEQIAEVKRAQARQREAQRLGIKDIPPETPEMQAKMREYELRQTPEYLAQAIGASRERSAAFTPEGGVRVAPEKWQTALTEEQKLTSALGAEVYLRETKQDGSEKAIKAAQDIYDSFYSRFQREGEGAKITQPDIDAAAKIAARRNLTIELDRPFIGSTEIRGMYLSDPKTGNRIVRVNPLMATRDTAIHEIGHDVFQGVTNPSMRKSLLESAQDSPAYKSELLARNAEVQEGKLTPKQAQEIALEEGLIQSFGEQIPNIQRSEIRSWFNAFKASTKQLFTGKVSPEDAIAWMHYATTESVPWKGVTAPKAGEQRTQRDEELQTISERRSAAYEKFKQSTPGSQAEMMESGRIFSPNVRTQLEALQSGGTLDREALQAAINRDIPVRKVPEFSSKSLPDFNTIRSSLSDPRKKANVGKLNEIPAGSEMTLRQDVPAMTDFGVGVVTGTSGDITTYEPFIRVRNIKMVPTKGMENQSLKIGAGAAKNPAIVAKGTKHESQSIPSDINTWTQVGFNPDRHSYFYDRADGVTPVVGGDEAVQIGNTVFVKNPQTGDPTSFRFQRPEEKTRKFAGRVAEAESVPEEVRQTVRQSPESQYEQQKVNEVVDRASSMTMTQLAADMADPESNTRVASGMETFSRQINSGDMVGASSTALSLSKSGTTWGQLINQFKLLNSSTPEGLVRLVQDSLANKKRPPLTQQQAAILMDGASRLKLADNEVLAAGRVARDAFAANDVAAINQSIKQLDLADAKRSEIDVILNEAISKINPADAADLFISMVQGSVMGPISIVRNVVGNAINYPLRELGDAGAALIDGALSKDKNNSFNIRARTVDRIDAIGRSLPAVAKTLLKGSNAMPYELGTSIGNPLNFQRAWRRIAEDFANGKIGSALSPRNLTEATIGILPDIMLRLTQATDIPFRQAERARIISEIGRTKGLSEAQIQIAVRDPKLAFVTDVEAQRGRRGFTEDDLATIETESARSVFQQDNTATKAVAGINRFIKNELGSTGYIPYRLISLFQKTPINVAAEALQFTPAGALQDWSKMTPRDRNIAASRIAVGAMVTTAFGYLYHKGIITPNLDTAGETNKARELAKAGGVMPPGTINLSAVKRLVGGGKTEFQGGDTVVDLSSLGTAGALGIMAGTALRQSERGRTNEELMTTVFKGVPTSGLNFVMEQQFLKGTSDFIKLLSQESSNSMDRWLKNLAVTAATPLAPAVLGSVRRAERDKLPVIGGQSFIKDTVDELNQRYAALGLAIPGVKDPNAMPVRRDLWGQAVEQTPKGSNPWVYQFFNAWKAREIDADPLNTSIYTIWRRTADNSAIPSVPNPSLTWKQKTYERMAPEQFDRYSELVGQYRRLRAEQEFMRPRFQQGGDERKLKLLQRAYDDGLLIAKKQFVRELIQSGQTLTPVAARRGFQQPSE